MSWSRPPILLPLLIHGPLFSLECTTKTIIRPTVTRTYDSV
jgi:hypothetical protein